MRRIDLRNARAARPATIRDINRQIVLNYVREREPISRAEIARETALQRSTISEIVEALKTDGLVEELGSGESTGGRRPTLIRLRTTGAMAIGVDITPAHTTVATSDLAGTVIQKEIFPTFQSPVKELDHIVECVRAFSNVNSGAIESVGVSLPGLVDPTTGRAVYVPYFKWRDWPIRAALTAAVGLNVIIENDANAAALAELWFGRPEVSQARNFIMVLVGEGVGTGIVFDGEIYRGVNGAAGEFGHMIIGSQSPVACSCGSFDCWEGFSSERSAIARYETLSHRTGAVSFSQLIEAANAGDHAAACALADTGHYLGIGISNLVVGFSPEAVIVCGAISRAWKFIAGALDESINRSVRRGLPPAPIVPSSLGDHPTLRGALSLVLAGKFAAAQRA